MSLYTEAVDILSNTTSESGSLRSVIYNNGSNDDSQGGKRERKSQPATLYALITEVAKWNVVLKEVIDASGLLRVESKVCD